jgi:hypothetical protein
MEDIEIINLWKSNDKKINENLLLNRKNADEIIKMKAQYLLSSMKPIKTFTIMIGVLWVGLGTIVLGNIYFDAFSEANKFFLFSATLQVGLTAIALFLYLYQLITIHQVDITEPILKTQKKLASLKASTLWVARILFLQLPVWTTFYWNGSMLENGNWFLWIIQGTITFLFTYVAIWLFFNIKFENRNKKWFRLIFKGKEWTPLMKSLELLGQTDEYKTESKPEQNAST